MDAATLPSLFFLRNAYIGCRRDPSRDRVPGFGRQRCAHDSSSRTLGETAMLGLGRPPERGDVISDRLVHLVARVALLVRPPLDAKRLVDAFGRLLPPLSPSRAMRVARTLEGSGTCLTRALAVASRLRGSEVVLGGDGSAGASFSAHAWVERDGVLIGGNRAARYELARLRTP
jgi:hypothetical protein